MIDNKNMSYVLISAVKNEEKYIHHPLESVMSQTCTPLRWVIVSDGSEDGTDDILRKYQERCDFLQFIRRDAIKENIGFMSKVFALRQGYETLREVEYNFIGILDGDISFDPTYYENILTEFGKNKKLGISGGYIYEPDKNGVYRRRTHNRVRSVAGAVQMYRRECYEMIGGLQPIIYGGEDTYAEIVARINNWEVQAFPEYKVFHHKPGYEKRGVWKERFREGRLDYVLGYRTIYELLKLIRRIPEYPYFCGAFVRIIGYVWAFMTGEDKIPPPEILIHIKKEQWDILRKAYGGNNKN